MSDWNISEYLQLGGIVISGVIAFTVYLLQQRLSDKQRVDHRLEIENKANQKLYDIQYKDYSREVQLYNSRLLDKKYFSQNKRSILWGYPYHAAELYAANFDGLEFILGIEEWSKKKYYKVGVIYYENILGIKPEGDGSFNGMILYVKPRIFQKDKYSIAYKSFRYYPIKKHSGCKVVKPIRVRFRSAIKKVPIKLRYHFYCRWKHMIQKRNTRQ